MQQAFLSFVICLFAMAIPATEAPRMTPPETPKDEPAADWRAWRAFHERLEFLHESLINPEGVFAGLNATEVDIVLTAGFDYLNELRHIDAEARMDISRRYGPKSPSALAAVDELKSQGWIPHDFVPIPARTPDGRPIKDALREDGFLDRLELKRNSALRAHWESLAESIGLYSLVRLERYIEEEAAPDNTHIGDISLSPSALDGWAQPR